MPRPKHTSHEDKADVARRAAKVASKAETAPVAAPKGPEARPLGAAQMLHLQRTVGNQAVSKLLPQARRAGAGVQRLSVEEAFGAIERSGVDMDWYVQVGVPALKTIATKAGQTYDAYLGTMNEDAFVHKIQELRTEFQQEPPPGFWKKLGNMNQDFVDSEVYPGKKRLKGTNLLVETHGNFDDRGRPTEAVLRFAERYRTGTLTWYRAMGVGHFAWSALRQGVLSSEGTEDNPTFTMDARTPTRWLPGLYELDGITKGIAMTIAREEAGLRALAARQEVPTGVVLRYNISPDAPVAYLNDGEQVIRGPITGGNLRVEAVFTSAAREVGQNLPLDNLPPAAPYRAAEDSPAILDWGRVVATWMGQF